MTNWEFYFGTPARAYGTEVVFHSWPFSIVVCRTHRMSSCTASREHVASFREERDYRAWLDAEHDDGTIRWDG